MTFLPTPLLSYRPGRYKFTPTNKKDTLFTIILNDMDNKGPRLDGNIYVYDNPKKFGSSGFRTYFNRSFNSLEDFTISTDQNNNNKIVYNLSIFSQYYQEFDYDGLGGRGLKIDSRISFVLKQKYTSMDNFFNDISFIEINGNRYYFPNEDDINYISYQFSLFFFIASCVASFVIATPHGGSKKSGKEAIYLAAILYKGVFYRFVSVPMALLMVRTMIQYTYLAYLWPSFVWFLSFGCTICCFQIPNRAVKFIGIFFSFLG